MDGKLSIVQGDPGDGKSTLILNIAVKLSRGECIDENMNMDRTVGCVHERESNANVRFIKERS